jgi:predicted hydrocarbon binding protein
MSAAMSGPQQPLHERLRFDTERGEVLDQSRRYLLLRSDVLMGLFDSLPADAREQALRAFAASVTRFGSDSVRAYAAQVGADALLATMQDAAASLGWGRWRLVPEEGVLRLEVENSPFAAGTTRADAPACHAIVGMLQALAAARWPEGAGARELSCAAQARGGDFVCRFEARPLFSHR